MRIVYAKDEDDINDNKDSPLRMHCVKNENDITKVNIIFSMKYPNE